MSLIYPAVSSSTQYAHESYLTLRSRHAACRSCGHKGLEPVLDLGVMPQSDGFLSLSQLDAPEPRWPLELAFCPRCTLVQILQTVPPEELFREHYVYFSSFSETLLKHARENALSLIDQCALDAQSLVIELASNDGYLLRNFTERGIPALGIDPAQQPAAAARAIGVPTLNAFFGRELAQQLRDEGTLADVIIANNVLAHVADTNGFVAGIRLLLKDDGLASIEFPYVRDLIDHCEFDTIYHEHLCYFSVHAVDALFRRHGLYVNHIVRVPIHGGSLRLHINPFENVQESVHQLLEEERQLGLTEYAYYQHFAARVDQVRSQMRELLAHLKSQEKRIAAYGAAAKGTIMLNAIGATCDIIEFVVDRNTHKHGRWVPGVRIPILPVEALMQRRPDYAVILPWNFKDEIIQQQSDYLAAGGRFIVPIPEPRIIYGFEHEA